jgi:hypothetical protein
VQRSIAGKKGEYWDEYIGNKEEKFSSIDLRGPVYLSLP